MIADSDRLTQILWEHYETGVHGDAYLLMSKATAESLRGDAPPPPEGVVARLWDIPIVFDAALVDGRWRLIERSTGVEIESGHLLAGGQAVSDITLLPLTCGYCRRAPATHVLVAYYNPMIGRRAEMVCRPCGDWAMLRSSPVCHTIQMYPVRFSVPEQAPMGNSLQGNVIPDSPEGKR